MATSHGLDVNFSKYPPLHASHLFFSNCYKGDIRVPVVGLALDSLSLAAGSPHIGRSPHIIVAHCRVGLDSGWVSPWTNSRMDSASTSSAIRSVGLNGVQMMLRQLASVGENYTHSSTVDASSWNLWPSLHTSGSSSPQPSQNHNRNVAGVRFRNTTPSDLLAMADRVREVLPHMPDELVIQDLLRTNNINITVNNLLMMQ